MLLFVQSESGQKSQDEKFVVVVVVVVVVAKWVRHGSITPTYIALFT